MPVYITSPLTGCMAAILCKLIIDVYNQAECWDTGCYMIWLLTPSNECRACALIWVLSRKLNLIHGSVSIWLRALPSSKVVSILSIFRNFSQRWRRWRFFQFHYYIFYFIYIFIFFSNFFIENIKTFTSFTQAPQTRINTAFDEVKACKFTFTLPSPGFTLFTISSQFLHIA